MDRQAKRRGGHQRVKRRYRINKMRFSVFIMTLTIAAVGAILLISAASGAAPAAGPKPEELPLTGRVIVVDAGHGGFDIGATGVSGSLECDLNLSCAEFLKAELEANGARVVMTREDAGALAKSKDEDMAERRRIIVESKSDIVISIHMNSFEDASVSGPLVLFMPGSQNGELLATAIQEQLNAGLSPGQPKKARAEDLYILKSGSQPCVLVECGYLSNAEEEDKLKDAEYQKKIAKHILEGVLRFFK